VYITESELDKQKTITQKSILGLKWKKL
jgi:hypothetical protein